MSAPVRERVAAPLRVTPWTAYGGGRARRLLERNVMVYRRSWLVIVTGFFEPVFYLFSLGIGIGGLVGRVGGVDYTTFVAPALLASSAMNGATFESTFNVFFKLKYAKTYEAVLATPVGVLDIAVGEVAWALIRGSLYAVAFLAVMAGMGLVHSPWGLLAVPAALLIGLAFASVGMAATSYMRGWQDFEFVQLATLPLFLFSGTFYPLATYPPGLRWVVQATPLYHGVTLVRSLTLGDVHPSLLAHAAYLAVMAALGMALAARRLGVLLLK